MSIQEYIASGILEIYASGGLSVEEQADVRRMAETYPEVRAELDNIEATLETYATAHATQPPSHLKARIFSNLHGHATETQPQAVAPKVIPFRPEGANPVATTRSYSWLAAAAIILLLISAGLNFYLYSNWQKSQNSLASVLARQTALAQNMQQARIDLSKSAVALRVLENAGTKHIALEGLPKSPESRAVIHWDAASKTVLLEVKKLPAAPEGYAYQLWALHNGQPIDAGLISPADTLNGIQQMKPIREAEAFALTLEPTGGSVNPTLTEMYLLGKM